MNKLLKISHLTAAMAVALSLWSCGNSSNSGAGNAENAPKSAPAKQESPAKEEKAEPSASQEIIDKQESNPDEYVSTEEIEQAYSCPAELKYSQQSDEYITEKFYPIGWSKDGLFAYIIEPADEASGQYFFEFVIRNMISDKVVFSWKPEDELEEGNIKQMWKDYNVTFSQKLNQYKIIQQEKPQLLGTEFSYKDNKFKVTIENKMVTDPDYGFEVVKGTTIYIKSPELGTKNIYSYTEKEQVLCIGKIVQGVLLSPFEDRVAVLVKTEKCGYEGPPNVIEQFLVGANLVESFKK